MRYLADTHAVVWWVEDSPRLSKRARDLFTAGDNKILWSIASSWELAIKTGLGRLTLQAPLAEFLHGELPRQGIELLPIDNRHAVRVAELPNHHGDPFDRMLVAQAQVEGVPILSTDPKLRAYDVEVIW